MRSFLIKVFNDKQNGLIVKVKSGGIWYCVGNTEYEAGTNDAPALEEIVIRTDGTIITTLEENGVDVIALLNLDSIALARADIITSLGGSGFTKYEFTEDVIGYRI